MKIVRLPLLIFFSFIFNSCNRVQKINEEKTLTKTSMKDALPFNEGLSFVTHSTDYTDYFIIDTMGNVINKGPFDEIFGNGFRNGEAEVRKNGKCIGIDKSGKKIRNLENGCQGGR